MVYRRLIFIGSIFLFFNTYTSAQIILPPIYGPIVDKISIFIPTLTNVGAPDQKASEFVKVVQNDLLNTGLFDVHGGSIDNFIVGDSIQFQSLFEAGAEALVKGEYVSTGGNIQFALRLFDVVGEKPLVGRTYDATPGRVREAAHRFADLIMKQLTGIDGFFTSKIAFVSGSGNNRNLYIMDYDGENIRRLTNHGSLLLSPHCSPDGSKIIFNSDKVWDQDLYVIDLGSKTTEKRLTRAFKLEQSPEWSPSGRKIAFSADGDIYVANPDGSGAVDMTRSHSIDVSPTWSPDGRRIAFVSDRGGSPQIYVMSSNGGNLRKVSSGGYATDPSWSPDPTVNGIAFVKVEGSEANIFTVNPDGSDEQRLTWSSRRNETPSWAPDGHYIGFTSNRSGSKDLYIMYLTGQNQRPLTKGGSVYFPTWCR